MSDDMRCGWSDLVCVGGSLCIVDGGHAAMSDERLEKAYTTLEWSPGTAPPIISTANGHVKRESADIIPGQRSNNMDF
jgi:hypothetical protein